MAARAGSRSEATDSSNGFLYVHRAVQPPNGGRAASTRLAKDTNSDLGQFSDLPSSSIIFGHSKEI